jgi:penicillin-binding protein 1C
VKPKRKQIILAGVVLLVIAYYFCLPRQLFDVSYATVVNDRNGELLGARIAGDEQWRFPANDTLPEKFKTCLTQFEDRYFQYHWGVNPLAIGRATLQNIRAKRIVSGGSTITMQLIRLSRNKRRTFLEKCYEAILATRIELRYSKDKILALYASHAPFGGNVVGLDAAAWRYFGHSTSQLSWAESATLAVLPNAPSALHPARNRNLLLEKRNRLLKRLLDKKIINETEYELALSETLPGEPLPLPQIAPHLVSHFHNQRKGQQWVSTVDKNLQLRVENVLDRWQYEFLANDIRNAAALVIDVRTNQVIAYCGNTQFLSAVSGNQVDIIQANRSTGSILKPFLYCALLQEGEILPHTLLPDIPVNFNGFAPQNFNMQFEGAVPASEAVSRSLNVPLVSMLRTYSVPKFYDFLRINRIAALPNSSGHYGLSLILGGAEAKLCDVTGAYANMARTLLGLESTRYTLCLDEPPQPMNNTFRPGAVWQVFECLTEVNRPEQIDWKMLPSMQKVAWKTGTSYGFRDAWAVGVTSQYVVGVWVGNASGEGRPNLTGARTAGPVMFDIFDLLESSRWFEAPGGEFIEAEICRQSGHLKGRFCEDIDTALICTEGLRSDPCPYHIRITLTPDRRFRVYEHCAETNATIRESWFMLPPAWAWYYRQKHPGYKSLPPLLPGCGADGLNPMQFIYPQNNATIFLQKQLDGSIGDVTFELAHGNRNATVFWHINNEYITSTTDFHTLSVKLSAGIHAITVVDGEGNTLSCRIEAR